MAFVRVYFNGELKDEIALDRSVISVGRGTGNDIRIDNAGVSTHHARIIKQPAGFLIEDVGSTNGVFVNGERVTRKAIDFGDEVKIFRHTLSLASAPSHQRGSAQVSDERQVDQGETVEMDLSRLGDLVKGRRLLRDAYLLLPESTDGRSRYPIARASFKIGKKSDSDLRLTGWLAPRLAARIVRKEDGFYLVPERRGRVRINGSPLYRTRRLHDGDRLGVRGLSLHFHHKVAAD